ncbi:MAG TPA: tetratricopeptide repeat protein, partial [Abditibacteriaceae bacterium]|nr:tetratricopeptide repeat protein [Abditibacteriaceae bacterium]
MARLTCGRCGNRTAPNSTYCPRCRWTLFVEAPEDLSLGGPPIGNITLPAKSGGFLKRRRYEGQRAHLERAVRAIVDVREHDLEKRLEGESDHFETQRALGLLTLLEGHWERAHAHLHRAYELNPHDLATLVNLSIVLARRGQLQPAIDLLEAARKGWPDNPLVLFNLALVTLEARRAPAVIELADALERLCQESPSIAADYHETVLSARGLALLLLNDISAARATLESAVRHIPVTISTSPSRSESHGAAGASSGPANGEAAPPRDTHDGMTEIAADDEPHPAEEATMDADLLNNLAIAEAQSGNIDGAVKHLLEALSLESGHTRALNNLGVLAYQQGQVSTAFKYVDLARKIEEHMGRSEATTHNHLGVILSALGETDESLAQFERAGNLEHAEFEVFYNLGRAYIERGVADKGVEFLRRAYQLHSTHADVHALLGAAYLLRGKSNLMPEAIKYLKRALQINSHHHVAMTDLVMALLEINNAQDALRFIQQSLRLRPKSAEALFLLGICTLNVGDEKFWAQATTQFGAALAARPDLVACLYNAALSQHLMGLQDVSAVQLQQVTERDPSFAPAYYLIGVGHANAKRLDEALAAWKVAVRYEPSNADLHANMGYIYYHRSDWDNAIKCFMHAHALAPEDPGILASLGLCFARANMLNRAIPTFKRSLEIRPRSPVTHSNIGLAYYLHKQVETAVEHWRIVSQQDSAYASRREEEQYRTFDDSIVDLRPLNWRERIVKLAPILPRAHTRLLPGYNTRAFRPVVTEPELQEVQKLR